MNVQVNKPKQDKPFPKLMVNIEPEYDLIILFTDEVTGTVISDNDTENPYEVGYYSKAWTTKDFTDFEGSITLSND